MVLPAPVPSGLTTRYFTFAMRFLDRSITVSDPGNDRTTAGPAGWIPRRTRVTLLTRDSGAARSRSRGRGPRRRSSVSHVVGVGNPLRLPTVGAKNHVRGLPTHRSRSIRRGDDVKNIREGTNGK